MKRAIGIVITDTHMHRDNTEDVKDIFDQVIEKCAEFKTTNLFFDGDWFTNRTAQPLSVLMATQEILNNLSRNNINCKAIKGNHDAVGADSEESYLDIFYSDSFEVFRKESLVFNDSNMHIYMIPYFKETGSYMQRLKNITDKLKPGVINILLTHIAVNGVRNNDGTKVENELSSDLFAKFHKVLIGHYHSRSQIGENIFYIGASHPQDFGADNQRGLTVIYNDGSIEFVKLRFKEFHKQIIDIDDIINCEFDHETYKGHNVRLIIRGDASKLASFNKAMIPDWIDYKFETEEPITYEDIQARVVCHDKTSISASFEEFAILNNIEHKQTHIKYLSNL